MSYADRDRTAENTVGVVISSVLLGLLVAGLIVGLAAEGIQKVIKKVTTVDIKKEEEKPKEPPPPPKKAAAPPIVAPPVKINVNVAPPPVTTVTTPPPVAPVVPVIAPPAPVPAPPPPPPPKFQPKAATPRGAPGNWANANDYPSGPLRREEEGVTRFRVTVGPDGRVTSCDVTGSSGSSELDSTTCSLIQRRGRFNPATDGEGNPVAGAWSSSVRWQIPKD